VRAGHVGTGQAAGDAAGGLGGPHRGQGQAFDHEVPRPVEQLDHPVGPRGGLDELRVTDEFVPDPDLDVAERGVQFDRAAHELADADAAE
jgi:hypothetical protein